MKKENLNKNDGKHLQKIENFNNYEFEFGTVVKFEFNYIDEDEISLQLHIVATNLDTQEEKIFSFQNGKNDFNYQPDQEKWEFYSDGSENVDESDDEDLIEYLNEYLDEYNYASDYSIDEAIN